MAKSVKEREKAQQDKHQAILSGLLRDEDNKYCADCHAKGPRWASWNLGVFLCIRCAGIHRNLGVHISKVKSVNLDSWTPEQLYMVQEIGNSRAMAVYEANVPDGFRRPQTDSSVENFIRDKYERKRYIAREWIPPKPPSKINDAPIEEKKKERKSATPKASKASAIQLNNVSRPKSSSSSNGVLGGSVSRPQVRSPAAPASVPASVKSAASADLLGLSVDSSPASSSAAAAQPAGNDLFGDFLSASSPAPPPAQQPPQQTTPPSGTSEKPSDDLTDTGLFQEKPKSTKESIMALYGSCASNQQPLYGVPGGIYMSPQGQQTGAQPANNAFMMNGAMMGAPSSQQPPMMGPMMTSQAGIMTSQSGMMSSQPGMMMTSQPGMMMTSQPGMMTSQSGMMTSQPGMMTSQPGMMTSQPGMMTSQPGAGMPGMQGGFSTPQSQSGGMMPQMGHHQMGMGVPGAMGTPANNPMMMMGQPQQQPSHHQQQMMFNQQQQQQPSNMINSQHLQQVQHQMASMRLGSPGQSMMGMPQQGTVAAGSGGWGGQPMGNTLSTNLWN